MCAARDIAPTSSGRPLEVAGPHSIIEVVQTMEAFLESHSRHVILGRQAVDVTCCSVTQRHTSSVESQTSQRGHPLLCRTGVGTCGSCPAFAFRCLSCSLPQVAMQKLGDPAVFMPCRNGTATIIQHLQREFKDKHPELQEYEWASQWNRGLPTARILPKGSKHFAKARRIIAYTRCWHAKASSFLATALYSIMQVLFPPGTTLNINSVTAGLRQAWKYMQQFEQDEPVMIQQDLIGFFNSVPHSRICAALQLVLYQLQEHFGQDLDSLTFQVDHKAGTKDLRIFKDSRSHDDFVAPLQRSSTSNMSWN